MRPAEIKIPISTTPLDEAHEGKNLLSLDTSSSAVSSYLSCFAQILIYSLYCTSASLALDSTPNGSKDQ